MKANKGFTLVELLAVITIIGLLGLIALESIESVNKGNKEKTEEIQRQNILTSAIAYVPTSNVYLPNVTPDTSGCAHYKYTSSNVSGSGNKICEVQVSLEYLVNEGVLEDDLSNPENGEKINMSESYVSIWYLTSASSYTEERKAQGQFDGPYFYELHYVY